MKERRGVEINCPECGKESLLVRRPIYEGLKKTGETLHCAACGCAFGSESEVPFKEARTVSVFTEADRSSVLRIFDEGENRRLCRYCAHYVVNPFTQWCGAHKKEVEATDSCDQFEEKEERAPPI